MHVHDRELNPPCHCRVLPRIKEGDLYIFIVLIGTVARCVLQCITALAVYCDPRDPAKESRTLSQHASVHGRSIYIII